MALETEQETYERELEKLAASMDGKFVLIKADKVIGAYDTYGDALKVGYDTFGLKPFLVKRIEVVPTAHSFSRDIGICRT
ncbi:MAG TPA: hypothetical protein VF624_18500 [Tepidisphaeraceae bacterium]|jgi:hypothetical protein